MSESEFERRKELSFLQAEGVNPLPALSRGTEVTPAFRALSYDLIVNSICAPNYRTGEYILAKTRAIWVSYFGRFSDDLPLLFMTFSPVIKEHISSGAQLLDLLQYCARNEYINPSDFELLKVTMLKERIGYRFVGTHGQGNLTLLPITDEDEAKANQEDYKEIEPFPKSQEHFTQAIEEIKNRNFRGSVKESISGVESLLKVLADKSSVSLGDGLSILEKRSGMNPLLKAGLTKLYAWTNGPDGIRHALADGAKGVSESEARFMLSTCLAFAAWLKRTYSDA